MLPSEKFLQWVNEFIHIAITTQGLPETAIFILSWTTIKSNIVVNQAILPVLIIVTSSSWRKKLKFWHILN